MRDGLSFEQEREGFLSPRSVLQQGFESFPFCVCVLQKQPDHHGHSGGDRSGVSWRDEVLQPQTWLTVPTHI